MDTKTTAEHAAQQLRDMILNGRLAHGAPLRQETLSQELGVSRTPLRQALHMLDQEGLVETVGFRGARVKQISLGMIDDLFDMRLALEPLALQSAFAAMTKLDLAAAEMALDDAELAATAAELAALNWRFHHALYRPCGRDLLLSHIEQLCRTAALADVISQSIDVRQKTSHSEHLSLLAACRDGAQADAITLLRDHLRNAHQDLRQNFKD